MRRVPAAILLLPLAACTKTETRTPAAPPPAARSTPAPVAEAARPTTPRGTLFSAVRGFSAGAAAAALAGRWGLVTSGGRWLLPPRYDSVTDLEGGIAYALDGNRTWRLRTSGPGSIEPVPDDRVIDDVTEPELKIDEADGKGSGKLTCTAGGKRRRLKGVDEADASVNGRAVVRAQLENWATSLVFPCSWIGDGCGLFWAPRAEKWNDCTAFNGRGLAFAQWVDDPLCRAGPGCAHSDEKIYTQAFDRDGTAIGPMLGYARARPDGSFDVGVPETGAGDGPSGVRYRQRRVLAPEELAPPPGDKEPIRGGWRPVPVAGGLVFANAEGRELVVERAPPEGGAGAVAPPAAGPAHVDGTSSGSLPNTAPPPRLAPKDLEGKSPAALKLLRNEIFARHGYVFRSPELAEHFGKQPWYRPDPTFDESRLDADEKANVALIRSAERAAAGDRPE